MSRSQSVLYSPYGSFALKARYQRNLFTSQLLVVACIALTLGIVKLWPKDRTVIVDMPLPPVTIDSVIVKIGQQHSIVREGKRREKPTSENHQGAIPVPVTDSIEFDNTIYSRQDLVDLIGPGDSLGRGNISIDTNGTDALDDPTVFVPLEKLPAIVTEVEAEYPRLAREAMIEGTVVLWGKVDEHGQVIETRVARSSGVGSLDQSAALALRQFRFSPGIQNGRPVKCWIAKSFKFELE